MLFSFFIFIPAKSAILGNFSDALHMENSLHCSPVGCNGDEIIPLSHSGPGALAAKTTATATAPAELRLLARWSFGRAQIDLT